MLQRIAAKLVLLLLLICAGMDAQGAEQEQDEPVMTPGRLFRLDEYGERTGGLIPVRRDSPAFHDGLADREDRSVLPSPYDAASMGGIPVMSRTPSGFTDGANASFMAAYGSFDALNLNAATSYGINGSGVEAGFGHVRSGAIEGGGGILQTALFSSSSPFRYQTDKRGEDSFDSRNLWIKVGVGDKKTSSAGYTVSFAHVDAGQVLYPHLKLDADHDRSSRMELNTWLSNPFSVIRDISVSARWKTSSAVLDDRLRESARMQNGLLRPFSTQNEGNMNAIGTRILVTANVPAGSLRLGADYAWRNPDATSTQLSSQNTQVVNSLIPDVDNQNTGIFADYRLPLQGGYAVSAGIRGDVAAYESKTSSELKSPTFFEPSGYLKGSYRAFEELEFSLGMGCGVDMPDPMEMYFGVLVPSSPLLGSQDIRPGRVWQPEISVSWNSDGRNLGLVAHYNRTADFIAVRMSNAATLQRYFVNSEAESWGILVQGGTPLPRGFAVRAKAAYNQGDDLEIGQPLPETTPLTFETALSWKKAGYFIEAVERIGSRQWRTDSTLNEQATAAWAVTDVRAGASWKLLSLTLGVNNLADARYTSYRSWFRDPLMTGVRAPEAGRFFYTALEVKL